MSNVSLATPIWGRTYPYMLGPEGMLARNMRMLRDVDFVDTMVLVNNEVPLDPKNVLKQWWARTWVRYIKSDVAVRQFINLYQTLSYAPQESDMFQQGFWYSAGPLAAIAMCKTPYLLFIADDVELVRSEPGWVQQGIALLQANPKAMCVTPMWDKTYEELLQEHPDNHEAPAMGGARGPIFARGFSDHCFLIRVADFRKPIYGETNPESDVLYPVDGAFEKRIGAYMRNHDKYRLVMPQAQWAHQSYDVFSNHQRPVRTIPMPKIPDFER